MVVKEVATIPVMSRLTPNVTDITLHRPRGREGRRRLRGSFIRINTIIRSRGVRF